MHAPAFNDLLRLLEAVVEGQRGKDRDTLFLDRQYQVKCRHSDLTNGFVTKAVRDNADTILASIFFWRIIFRLREEKRKDGFA